MDLDLPAIAAQEVDQQAEGHPPADGYDEVGRPVDKGAAEGEEPYDGQDDAETGNDFGVDEPRLIPRGAAGDRVEVVAIDAGHDTGEDQLPKAEDHRQDVDENHLGG